MRKVLSQVRRCIDDYEMIGEGEKIAVGVSGGKDSLLLLYALYQLSKFHPKHFTVCAITLDLGFNEADYGPLAVFYEKLGIEYKIEKTDIGEIVFDIRKESNPCALCAKMRRGALHEAALSMGTNKVALGHNKNDVLETFLLCLVYEGRLGCFSPVTWLDRKDIYLIRPLVYMYEYDIRSAVQRLELPVVHNPCPANGVTKRQEMKELIRELGQRYDEFPEKVFGALQRSGLDGWKTPQEGNRRKSGQKMK